jgi:hypothetical protein
MKNKTGREAYACDRENRLGEDGGVGLDYYGCFAKLARDGRTK